MKWDMLVGKRSKDHDVNYNAGSYTVAIIWFCNEDVGIGNAWQKQF